MDAQPAQARPASGVRANRLSLTLYLAALALMPWSSFPPFPWLHENAQWSDAVVAAAALAWVHEGRRGLWRRHLSVAEVALAAYVVAGVASYLASASAFGGTAANLLGLIELAVLAFLTSQFASDPRAFAMLVRVVTATSLLVGGAALAGVALFYAGIDTSLVGGYGALVASADYGRAQAGLTHPALLGSYCIFASAVVARGEGIISPGLRRATQVALTLTVLASLSRAILGFLLAALLRTRPRRGWRPAALGATALCLALMALLTFSTVSLDPSHPFDASFGGAGESVRSQELRSSIDTILDHPVFGTGPGSLPGEAIGYGARQAHNTPVAIAATLGLPALLAFAALLVALWRRRARPTDRATWAALAGLGIDGLGQDVENFRHVWVTIGLAGATAHAQPARAIPAPAPQAERGVERS